MPSPFPELEIFIHETANHYNLALFECPIDEADLPVETVSGPATPGPASTTADAQVRTRAKGGEGMKRALEHYKDKFPHTAAILIGTRKGDPHGGELSPFGLVLERTSPGNVSTAPIGETTKS